MRVYMRDREPVGRLRALLANCALRGLVGRDGTDREGRGRTLAALPIELYGVSFDMKMSVRLARLPSFAMAKKATNEFPARASPS
jgi:hypothetical protein